jgi:hypothetical protein
MALSLLRRKTQLVRKRIPYGSPEWKRLYRGRAAVEREFGRLKNEYGSCRFARRDLARVRIHADLTMLVRLGQALARALEWFRSRHRLAAWSVRAGLFNPSDSHGAVRRQTTNSSLSRDPTAALHKRDGGTASGITALDG